MRMNKRALISVAVLGLVGVAVGPAIAKPGTTSAGTVTVNPSTVAAGSTGNYQLRFQAKGGFTNTTVWFGIPTAFTAPVIGGTGPGAISVLKSTCTWGSPIVDPTHNGFGGANWVEFNGNVSCPKGGNFLQIAYNKAVAPNGAASFLFPGFQGSAPASPGKVSVVAGPAANISFSHTPSDGPAGSVLAAAPQVFVGDQFNNPISGSVSLGLLKQPGDVPAAFNAGSTTATLVGGLANFPGMKINTAGVYKLKASLGSLSTTSTGFTINPAGPSALAFVDQPVDTAAGSTLGGASGVQVAIEDTFGNIETGDTSTAVNAAIKAPNTPGGSLAGVANSVVSNGVATFPGLSIDRQGVYTLTATAAPSLSRDSNAFTINAVVNRPQNGAGNWIPAYGATQWWLFEFGVDPSGDPYTPPNLQFLTGGAGATLGDLTSSGASGWSYSADTTDDRALQNPGPGDRASGALFSASNFQTVLQFTNAFSGKLTVYAVDWDTSNTRDEVIAVHDGAGTQTANLTSFAGGAYATFNITTGPLSNVTITVTNNGASPNAVISGVFLN